MFPWTYEAKYDESLASELITYFVRHTRHMSGDWSHITPELVEPSLREQGYPWDQEVQKICSGSPAIIMSFENAFSPALYWIGEGKSEGSISVTIDGVETSKSSGRMFREPYAGFYLQAYESRERAIQSGISSDVYSMLTAGFACLEAFFNVREHIFKTKNPSHTLPGGDRSDLETKIKKWLPIMTGGRKLELSTGTMWRNFKYLKGIRDNYAVHPKLNRDINEPEYFADIINRFRDIFKLIFVLHKAFNMELDRYIVRGMIFPDVKVVYRP